MLSISRVELDFIKDRSVYFQALSVQAAQILEQGPHTQGGPLWMGLLCLSALVFALLSFGSFLFPFLFMSPVSP